MMSALLRSSVVLLWWSLMIRLSLSDFASLALTTDPTTTTSAPDSVSVNYTFCAVFNPSYVTPPHQDHPHLFHRAVYPSQSRLGCSSPFSYNGSLEKSSVVLDRGGCTFYEKARASQDQDAAVVVVVYNSTNMAVPDLEPNSSDPSISIPVLIIGNDSGQQLKSWLSNSSAVYLSAYIPPIPSFDPSSILLFVIAVGTVLMAAFIANVPFQFLKYGLLYRPDNEHMFINTEDSGSSSKSLSVISTVIGMIIMVLSTCALLLLLYFFYTPMVYIVLSLYSVASVFGLYYLLSPFVALIKFGSKDKYRLPSNRIPILKYRPNILFFITVLGCVGVVLFWVLQRHSGYAWVIQDLLGFAFISMLLSRLRFLKTWVVATLMILLFFYDIFMVFITPYFTSDGVSVMEKAATGGGGAGNGGGSGVGVSTGTNEMLPVVFLVPKFWYPSPLEATCAAYVRIRPSSLLGYGDVGIPGLLVTLCLKFDFQHHTKNCFKMYYFTSGVAYIVGLACTYLGLTLMQTAQPALLYLVPTTLGSVLILSLFRKEFYLFFTGKERKSKTDSNRDKDFADNHQQSDNPESDIENETVFSRNENEALIRKE